MTAPVEVPCPVCDLPAAQQTDVDGDTWTACYLCRQVYVTPSWRDTPSMAFPVPEDQAEIDAVKRLDRESRGEA